MRGRDRPRRRTTCAPLPPARAGRCGSAPTATRVAHSRQHGGRLSIGPTASRATRRSRFWTTGAGTLWMTSNKGLRAAKHQRPRRVCRRPSGGAAVAAVRHFRRDGERGVHAGQPRRRAAGRRDGVVFDHGGRRARRPGAPAAEPAAAAGPHRGRDHRRPGDAGRPRRSPSPPGSGDLEVRYTALSFVNSQAVRFKYKLEGFDKDWVDVGPRRAAYYTNLPPASYAVQGDCRQQRRRLERRPGRRSRSACSRTTTRPTWFLGLVLRRLLRERRSPPTSCRSGARATVSASSCASSRSAPAICSRK